MKRPLIREAEKSHRAITNITRTPMQSKGARMTTRNVIPARLSMYACGNTTFAVFPSEFYEETMQSRD